MNNNLIEYLKKNGGKIVDMNHSELHRELVLYIYVVFTEDEGIEDTEVLLKCVYDNTNKNFVIKSVPDVIFDDSIYESDKDYDEEVNRITDEFLGKSFKFEDLASYDKDIAKHIRKVVSEFFSSANYTFNKSGREKDSLFMDDLAKLCNKIGLEDISNEIYTKMKNYLDVTKNDNEEVLEESVTDKKVEVLAEDSISSKGMLHAVSDFKKKEINGLSFCKFLKSIGGVFVHCRFPHVLLINIHIGYKTLSLYFEHIISKNIVVFHHFFNSEYNKINEKIMEFFQEYAGIEIQMKDLINSGLVTRKELFQTLVYWCKNSHYDEEMIRKKFKKIFKGVFDEKDIEMCIYLSQNKDLDSETMTNRMYKSEEEEILEESVSGKIQSKKFCKIMTEMNFSFSIDNIYARSWGISFGNQYGELLFLYDDDVKKMSFYGLQNRGYKYKNEEIQSYFYKFIGSTINVKDLFEFGLLTKNDILKIINVWNQYSAFNKTNNKQCQKICKRLFSCILKPAELWLALRDSEEDIDKYLPSEDEEVLEESVSEQISVTKLLNLLMDEYNGKTDYADYKDVKDSLGTLNVVLYDNQVFCTIGYKINEETLRFEYVGIRGGEESAFRIKLEEMISQYKDNSFTLKEAVESYMLDIEDLYYMISQWCALNSFKEMTSKISKILPIFDGLLSDSKVLNIIAKGCSDSPFYDVWDVEPDKTTAEEIIDEE